MKLMSTWRRFAQLTGSDRSIVLRTAFLLVATWLALRVAGFRRWHNFLNGVSPHSAGIASPEAALAQALHVTRLSSSCAHHFFLWTNCLERAMVLQFLLRRRGLPAELRFGARKQAARLEAHAWVACFGVPLNEDQGEHRHFLPFEGVSPRMETLPD